MMNRSHHQHLHQYPQGDERDDTNRDDERRQQQQLHQHQIGSATAALAAAGTTSVWDAEEGHLLSYFFSAGDENNFSVHGFDQEQRRNHHQQHQHHQHIDDDSDDQQQQYKHSSSSHQHMNQRRRKRTSAFTATQGSKIYEPPSTPAVRFYGGSVLTSSDDNYGSLRSSGLVSTSTGTGSVPSRVESSSSSSSSLGLISNQSFCTSNNVVHTHGHAAASSTTLHHPSQQQQEQQPPSIDEYDLEPEPLLLRQGQGQGQDSTNTSMSSSMLPPPPRLPSNSKTALSNSSSMALYPEHRVLGQWQQEMPQAQAQAQAANPDWGHHIMSQTSQTRYQQHNHNINTDSTSTPYQQPQSPTTGPYTATTASTAATTNPYQAASYQQPLMTHYPTHSVQQQQQQQPSFVPSAYPPTTTTTTTTNPQQRPTNNATTTTTTNPIHLPPSSLHFSPGSNTTTTTTTNTDNNDTTTTTTTTTNDERRARRLARNRESARQSRRRKKELLLTLGDKVNQLTTLLETERRSILDGMERGLTLRRDKVLKLLQQQQQQQQQNDHDKNNVTTDDAIDDYDVQKFKSLIRDTGVFCDVRAAAARYQYSALESFLLPKHHRFFAWLSLRQDEFFSAAKDDRAKMTGRVSSKQIGEELTQIHNSIGSYQSSCSSSHAATSSGIHISGSTTNSTATTATNSTTTTNTKNNKAPIVASGNDAMVFWPLFCYELMLSVDQEDRMIQSHKRINAESTLTSNLTDLSSSYSMASNLKRGTIHNSRAVAHRANSIFLDILTPEQTRKCMEWMTKNKKRCDKVMSQKMEKEEVRRGGGGGGGSTGQEGGREEFKKDVSLSQLCQRLSDVLMVETNGSTPQV